MRYERKAFGVLEDGTEIGLHVLDNGSMRATFMDYGASWLTAIVPSPSGAMADVLLGFSDVSAYMSAWGSYGAIVGRYANRIGQARFTIDGKEFRLQANFGKHLLHGGFEGWQRMIWTAAGGSDGERAYVEFRRRSPAGEGGFPGTVDALVRYSLGTENVLTMEYEADSDAPTHVNLCNHAYFNLRGQGRGDILSHELRIPAQSILETDKENVPTGRMREVARSPFDFREPKTIGRDFKRVKGYDHCFALDGKAGELKLAAEARDPESGRSLRVETTQPGMQLYTARFDRPWPGKRSSWYRGIAGFCLETQHFPDSPNHPDFPSTLVGPDRPYRQRVVYTFS